MQQPHPFKELSPFLNVGFKRQVTFSYIEGATQLARIYTYNQNRIDYINEQKSKGITSIQVEPFPEVYATRYSFLPHADITQDKESWYNIICANHYKIEEIQLK